jgi:hypothetical protein
LVVIAANFTGCANNSPAPAPAPTATNGTAKTDAVTGASRAVDEAQFEQKVSKENTNYIVIPTRDLTFTKDITVESGIKIGNEGAAEIATRSLGFGTYKEDKTIDKRITLTVPRLIIAGENVKFEYGIIKGDVYVTGAGFNIKDGTIDGNLYFATEELKNAFTLDATSKITGTTEVKVLAQ